MPTNPGSDDPPRISPDSSQPVGSLPTEGVAGDLPHNESVGNDKTKVGSAPRTGETKEEPEFLTVIRQMSLEDLDQYFEENNVPPEAKRKLTQGWRFRSHDGMILLHPKGREGKELSSKVHASLEMLEVFRRYKELKLIEKVQRLNKQPIQTQTQAIMGAAMGVPSSSSGPKIVEKIDVSKEASDFMKRTTDASQFELGLFHELGRGVRFELEGEVRLDEADRKDPERAAKKFLGLIRSMLAVKENAKILNEMEAAVVTAREVIRDYYSQLETYKRILATITATLCPDCNNRALIMMGMRAFNPPTESETQTAEQEVFKR